MDRKLEGSLTKISKQLGIHFAITSPSQLLSRVPAQPSLPINVINFNYIITPPSDRTITNEQLLQAIGFTPEIYRQFIERVTSLVHNKIDGNKKSEQVNTLQLTKILLSTPSESMAEQVNTLKSLLTEGTNSGDLIKDIKAINDLISSIYQLIEPMVNDLNSSLQIEENFEHYATLILSKVCKNISLLGANPVAISFSTASDYISTEDLREMISDITPEEWENIHSSIGVTDISSGSIKMLLDIMRGNQEEVIDYLKTISQSLTGSKAILVDFINNDIHKALTIALKHGQDKVVEYILEERTFIVRVDKESVTTKNKEIVYNENNLMVNLFSSLIRGDYKTCLKFIKPIMWDIYTENVRTEIIKFIILRSGEKTGKYLLEDLYANKLLKFHTYIELLKFSEPHQHLDIEKSIAQFIAKNIAANWFKEEYNYHLSTLHTIIEAYKGEQENKIFKYLHDEGLLSFSMYRDFIKYSENSEQQYRVEKFFFPYLETLRQERDDVINGEGYTFDEIIFALESLTQEELESFILNEHNKLANLIKDKNHASIKIFREKMEAILSKELFTKEEILPLLKIISDFNEEELLKEVSLEETKKPTKEPNVKHKKESSKSKAEKKQYSSEVKEPSLVKNKKNTKEPAVEHKKESSKPKAEKYELTPALIISEVDEVESKKSEQENSYHSDSPDAPGDGGVTESINQKEKYTPPIIEKTTPVVYKDVLLKTIEEPATSKSEPQTITQLESTTSLSTITEEKYISKVELPQLTEQNFIESSNATEEMDTSKSELIQESMGYQVSSPANICDYHGYQHYGYYYQPTPLLAINCNSYYYDNYGNLIYYYMDSYGNCIDQFGNFFATPIYHAVNNNDYGGGNYTGGGGAVYSSNNNHRKKSSKANKKHTVEGKKKADISSNQKDINQDPDNLIIIVNNNKKNFTISINSLKMPTIISDKAKEYEDAKKAIEDRKNNDKAKAYAANEYIFELKQNTSYVEISHDSDNIPKLILPDIFIKFAGVEDGGPSSHTIM